MWERTSSGGAVGPGGGSEIVVVVTAVVVACEVVVAVVVAVEVTVTVERPCPPPLLSLCCAPAKRPIKTELRRRKTRVAISKSLVSGDKGS